ncbi:MAG: hypothetical protein LUQ68_00985 [Methylococcaceae bacterium]|nr:hypothetical protein [Methylococcaceae bacterium]OYV23444.1 MAG: hypothetical protein CG442_185 [Methylococcaceae bacterium NSO1]
MLKKFFQRAIPEQYPDLSGLLEKQYNYQVAQNHIQHDNAQLSLYNTYKRSWIIYWHV